MKAINRNDLNYDLKENNLENGDKYEIGEDFITIEEYETRNIKYSEEKISGLFKDKKYFEKENWPMKSNHPSHTKIKLKAYDQERFSLVTNQGYVGDLLLPSRKHLKFKSKVKMKPLQLLSYARKIHCNDKKKLLYYDTSLTPCISEGSNFFDFLGEVYLHELEIVIAKGLLREYILKEENLSYLKGKLHLSRQIQENIFKPKFNCRYYDLTINNFYNQIILYGAYNIARLVNNPSLQRDLLHNVEYLKNEIYLLPLITSQEADSLIITRKNECYLNIIELAKIVIKETFYQYEGVRTPRGYNYLIDMNVVYERAIFKLFNEVLGKYDYKLEDQNRYHSKKFVEIPRKRELILIPDITISKNDSPIAIIDAKYKKNITNQDYYQILIYSLFLKRLDENFKAAILVHYDDELGGENLVNIFHGRVKLSEFGKNIEDIDLFRITINLSADNDSNFNMKKIEQEILNNIELKSEDWQQFIASLKII